MGKSKSEDYCGQVVFNVNITCGKKKCKCKDKKSKKDKDCKKEEDKKCDDDKKIEQLVLAGMSTASDIGNKAK